MRSQVKTRHRTPGREGTDLTNTCQTLFSSFTCIRKPSLATILHYFPSTGKEIKAQKDKPPPPQTPEPILLTNAGCCFCRWEAQKQHASHPSLRAPLINRTSNWAKAARDGVKTQVGVKYCTGIPLGWGIQSRWSSRPESALESPPLSSFRNRELRAVF